jgi:hypothetical protein
MNANPGGLLRPDEVIGRDSLIEKIRRALRTQSVVLASERRIGKTSVVRKMKAETPEDRVFIYRDIEGLHSIEELIRDTYHDIEGLLSRGEKAKLKFLKLLESLGGIQIGALKLPEIRNHWKPVLSALIDDLFNSFQGEVIFCWDELPLFVYNIANQIGHRDAMEFLDVLRSLRQTHSRLRMIFTGSVGIHHVVASLQRAGYSNDPTNDMAPIEVTPLTPEDGTHLARLLLEGEQINTFDEEPGIVGNKISAALGNIPFYIHKLIARIRDESRSCRAGDVKKRVLELLLDPNDTAHFGHYVTRLKTYYPNDEAQMALSLLGVLAQSPTPIPFQELANLSRHKSAVDDEPIFDVLNWLTKDHYLLRNHNGEYDFRYSIVKQWWKLNRG